MQGSLGLQQYPIPDSLQGAKQLCKELVSELETTRTQHKEQLEWLSERFLKILRSKRPLEISEVDLKEMFDEVEMTTEEEYEPEVTPEQGPVDKPKKKRKKKKKAIPDHLPRTIVEHDVEEEDKVCSKDGSELSPMGFDVKEELKYTPAKFEVIEHRYPKYSCSACDGVVRQPPAKTLIPRGYASSEFLANIAIAKYCDHLPLYRQEKIYQRDGVRISRQVMAEWMMKLGEALNPLIGIMHERILEADAISADETPVKVLTKDGRRTVSHSYMWQLSRWGPSPLVIFEWDPTRKKEVAERLVGDYSGYVQVDGYGGYNGLFEPGSPRKRVGCMAHCMRKYKDFIKTVPKEQRGKHPACTVMNKIDQLYQIEADCRGRRGSDRLEYRRTQGASTIFDELLENIHNQITGLSTSSPYYKALKYSSDEFRWIRRYLKHGDIEIDNNLAENAIRPFAQGRRNWLFILSENGARASANIYSVLISAKANGIEPRDYLTRVINALPFCETLEDYEALLPSRIS